MTVSMELTLEQVLELMKTNPEEERYEKLQAQGGVKTIAKGLGVDVDSGIDPSEVEARKERYGSNEFADPPSATLIELFIDALKDETLIILVIAALISLIVGLIFPEEEEGEEEGEGGGGRNTSWIEGAAILIAVFIVATVTALNDWSKERQFRSLNKQKENRTVKVLRNGVSEQTSSFELVAGDVVLLDTGDQVPADGLFIDGHDLRIDESTMTGEAVSVRKSDDKPFMLSGCQVTDGVGRMIVTCVGESSEWGMTLAKLQTEAEDTPLQESLATLAERIGFIGLGVATIVFVVLVIFWAVDVKRTGWSQGKVGGLITAFIQAITIIVVAVPEGLPLAVTIALAYSVKKMMADQNLVRHLAACEIMGGATNICSDKTGTLTENRMTVVQGWIAGSRFNEMPPAKKLHDRVQSILTQGIAVNSKAYLVEHDDKPTEFVGSKTECALLVMSNKLGAPYADVRKKEADNIVKLYTFSSAKKRMSVCIKHKNKYRLHIKGASEVILKLCATRLNEKGKVVDLEESLTEELLKLIDELASQGLRTLCLAYRDLKEWDDPEESPDTKLTLMCIVGIEDPVRAEVPDAIRQCQMAGITVRMVTGDNILTAKKIARECGILTDDGIAIEGPAFAKLSKQELDDILPKLQVLARSSPTDKHTLVTRLRCHKQIVAVTGDGTNDAPALKKAHVGLAMGMSGTEVAKEASDIIVMDDNFRSIVRAVVWGRSVFDNIRKFLQFQLTVNVAALLVALVGAVSQRGTPLTAIQLLWVNLIMDTMAALALATEPPTDELLNRAPINIRKESLISHIMWRNLLSQAAYQVIILLVVLYIGSAVFEVEDQGAVHYTIIFHAFVWAQVFNEINSRKCYYEFNVFEGMQNNLIFCGVIVVTILLQALIVSVPITAFQVTTLSGIEWGACILLGFFALPLGFIVRLTPVPPMPVLVNDYSHPVEEDDDDDVDVEKD